MAQIATVAVITGTGTAFAVNAQGISRALKAGDILQKGETIRTVGDVRVELLMEDGRALAVAPNQAMRLDDNVTESDQRPTAQDSAVNTPGATVDAVIQALERGTDPSTELDPTAAGLAGGGGTDGGSSFVLLLRIVEGVEPLAYDYSFTAASVPPDLQLEAETPVTTTLALTADPEVFEGSPGVTYTVTLGDPTTTDMTITLSNGALIVIPAGSSTGSVLVPVQGDDVYKDGETIQTTVDTVQGGDFTSITVNDSGVVTVVSDTPDVVTVGIAGAASVVEGDTAAYTVTLSAPGQTDVVVNLTYTGVAQDGSDYTGVTSVTIPAGSTSASFTIPTINDVLVEGSEVFNIQITSASGGNFEDLQVSQTAGNVSTSIIDNDTAPPIDTVFSVADASIDEGGLMTFTVTRSGDAQTSQTVDFATSIGAGNTAGTGDFTAHSGTLTFAQGETSKTFTVQTTQDALDEADETFTVSLSNATGGATISASAGEATGTILDDDEPPSISTDDGVIGANDSVYESGLDTGSSPSTTTKVAEGTFTIGDADGLSDIKTIKFDNTGGTGTTLSVGAGGLAALVGSTFTTANGTVILNSYGVVDGKGVFGYQFTLTSRTQDIPASAETNSFRITVIDSGLASMDATVTIDIVDDLPTITANSLGIPNVANAYIGHYDFEVGADSQAFADSFNSTSLQWNNPGSGYSLSYDSGASNATTRVYTGVDGTNATFFTLALHSDGTYDFNLVNPAPVITTNVPGLLNGISGGSNLTSYTIDSTNFGGAFNLVLTGYSGDSHAADTLTISASELGVGDNVMQGNKSDVLRFDVQQVTPNASLATLDVHVASTAGFKETDSASVKVHYTNGDEVSSNQIIGTDQLVHFTFDLNKTVDWVEIAPASDTVAFKIDGVALSYTVPTYPSNYQLDFSLTGSDADQDPASTSFSVAVNTKNSANYTIHGTSGDDDVYGTTFDGVHAGSGNDNLYGNGGSDTFVWRLAEAGSDTVKDFHINGINGSPTDNDALNLSDLLTSEHANSTSLDAYLDFSANGSGQTVIGVHAGGSGPVTQTITLESVQYSALQTFAGGTSDADIITKLLDNGNLKTDV